MSKKVLAICAFILGFVAVTAQILLLRETVASFGNQEIFYGLTITFWLLFIGLGSRWIKRFENKDTLSAFIVMQLFTIPLLFSSIFTTRIIKNAFGLISGSIVAPGYLILFFFLTLFPLCLLLGVQFSLLSKLFTDKTRPPAGSINDVYLFETIGAVAGSLLFNFLLVFLLKPFQILAILTLFLWFSITIAVGYLIPTQDKENRKFWGTFAIILLFFVSLMLISPVSSTLEKWSNKKAWQGYKLLKTVESPYGRITFTHDKREITAFRNSDLIFSTTEKPLNEEKIAIPLLSAPRPPVSVLLVGGGLGGSLEELLKYSSVENIDYLELDRQLLRQSRELLTRYNFFRSNRVQILSKDARQYLRQVSKNYDVIISGMSSPDSLMTNRFFSQEFFSLCKKRLAPNGVLAISLPYSESYMGPAMTRLNALVGNTFRTVFPNSQVWPGTNNYYIGYKNKRMPLSLNGWSLVAKMRERGIYNSFFNPEAMMGLLTSEKTDKVQSFLDKNDLPLNKDLHPYAYFYQQILWATYLKSPLKYVFSYLTSGLLYGFFALVLLIMLLTKFMSKNKNKFVPLAIFTVGAGSMIVQATNIYLFQVLVGSIYYQLGILILFFMLGISAGSYRTKQELLASRTDKRSFIKSAAALLFPAIILTALVSASVTMLDTWIYLCLFPLLSFLTGYPVGRIFGLGLRSQQQLINKPGFLAGLIYSSDIWGGALTALVTVIILMPLLGYLGALYIAIGFILTALLLAS